MVYVPENLSDRKLAEAPNWLWPQSRCGFFADGQAHYYDEDHYQLCCTVSMGTGRLADESDAEFICKICLKLLQTKEF